MFKVLSVLAAINVQTHSDINLGGQGMIITNQGMAIQPCFKHAKYMQFYKIGQYIVFIKTGTKHASKDGIELAVFKAFREVLLEVPCGHITSVSSGNGWVGVCCFGKVSGSCAVCYGG